MAFHEQDREDLMQEATAYTRRVRFQLLGEMHSDASIENSMPSIAVKEVFCGWRESRAWSVYFDQDRVLHFNSQDAIRSIHWLGEKLVAQNGHLLELRRRPDSGRVSFERVQLSSEREQELLNDCRTLVMQVLPLLASSSHEVVPNQIRMEVFELAQNKLTVAAESLAIATLA